MLLFQGKLYHNPPVFGRLTVLKLIGRTTGYRDIWLCGCYCGNYKEINIVELRTNAPETKSCGNCKDHLKYPKEYDAWRHMYQRCYNPKVSNYHRYGGRGITICERWRKDFLYFLEDVKLAPSSSHSLDRIDFNGHYEPGNVRWATRLEQNNNRENNVDRAVSDLLSSKRDL